MVSADVSVVSVKDAVEEAVRTIGHVDVLVNNAGIPCLALLQDTSPEKFEVCSVHTRFRICGGILASFPGVPLFTAKCVWKAWVRG